MGGGELVLHRGREERNGHLASLLWLHRLPEYLLRQGVPRSLGAGWRGGWRVVWVIRWGRWREGGVGD